MSESTWNDPRITSFVLNEMSDDERQQFEAELESNAELAAAVEEARGITGQLESLYAKEPTSTLDSDRRAAIVDAGTGNVSESNVSAGNVSESNVSAGKANTNPRTSLATGRTRSWGVTLTVLTMAAMLLLLVGVAPWLSKDPTTTAERQVEEKISPAVPAPSPAPSSAPTPTPSPVTSPITVEPEVEELKRARELSTDDEAIATMRAETVAADEPVRRLRKTEIVSGIDSSDRLSVPRELERILQEDGAPAPDMLRRRRRTSLDAATARIAAGSASR